MEHLTDYKTLEGAEHMLGQLNRQAEDYYNRMSAIVPDLPLWVYRLGPALSGDYQYGVYRISGQPAIPVWARRDLCLSQCSRPCPCKDFSSLGWKRE